MTHLAKLGELFRVGSSKRVLKSQWQLEGVPFYRGREVTRLAADGFVENELFISESLYEELSSQYGVPDVGDIMITAIGTIGNSYVVRKGDRFYFKDASVLWLKRIAEVSSEFINYWLKSDQFFGQLDRGNGATVDTLTIQKLQSVSIELPPLATQRRIVAILDEAFEGVATAQDNTEKNLQNAGALRRSYLEQLFTQHAESTPTQPLEVLTESDSPITYGVVKPGSEGSVSFVRGGDIAQGRVLVEQLRTIEEDVSRQYKRTVLRGGELLISLVGQPGQVAVAPEELKGSNIARQVGLIRLGEHIDAEYVRYFLQSPIGQASLGAKQSGSVQQVINLSELRQVRVPVPALSMQRKVVAALDAFSAGVDRLTALAQAKCDELDELKKSLLHQAFSGAL